MKWTWLCMLVGVVQSEVTNITSLCSPTYASVDVVKGERTYVCLNVNDAHRAVFMPVADHFTVLAIADTMNDVSIVGGSNEAFLTVSSAHYRTPYKLYTSSDGQVFPSLTAIVSVKQGQIQGVTWDDTCSLCASDRCVPNLYRFAESNEDSQIEQSGRTCSLQASNCTGDTESDCNLKVYVGWTGTDRDGRHLDSASLRFSQFQQYSLQSYYDSVRTTFSSLFN